MNERLILEKTKSLIKIRIRAVGRLSPKKVEKHTSWNAAVDSKTVRNTHMQLMERGSVNEVEHKSNEINTPAT
jgi:hypothetical protein